MAQLPSAFDPKKHEPNNPGGGRVGPGDYPCMLVSSKVEENSNKTGMGLKLFFNVFAGEAKGKTIFAYINVKHESKEAEEIGRGQFSALCHAIGELNAVTDSAILHNRPLMIRVVKSDGKDAEKFPTKVAGYYPISDYKEPPAGQQASQDAQSNGSAAKGAEGFSW